MASERMGAQNAHPHGLAMLSLGSPVFYGATGLGVQAGGRPGATHPLCGRRGPLPCHQVEKGTSGFWSSGKRGGGEGPSSGPVLMVQVPRRQGDVPMGYLEDGRGEVSAECSGTDLHIPFSVP